MDKNQQPLALLHGCNIISRKQRYMQIVTGYLYQFDPDAPHRPRPLSILVVLLNCLPPILLVVNNLMSQVLIDRVKDKSFPYQAINESVFITRVAKGFFIYRAISTVANVIILLAQHGSMANTMASCNNYVTEREQRNIARQTFSFFFMKSMANTAAYTSAVFLYYLNASTPIWWNLFAILSIYTFFVFKMMQNSPLVFSCYLGLALGKHVENFSTIYVDTMFDQFMKAIEKEDQGEFNDQYPRLLYPGAQGSSTNEESSSNESSCCSGCASCLCGFKNHIVRAFVAVYNFLRNLAGRLNMRKYPELPEMKMTKLSSTTHLQISETTRTANSHLIRVRLRRTQIMLSELRDLVSDINKTSSPILLMYLAYETVLIILVTTASIQAKVYKGLDILILPTISITMGLVANVVYLCTCLDETTKQLKLLINKLFDFIIMNHRIKPTGKRATRSKAQIHAADSEVCPLPGSEFGAINETWSQFQYTRKLANTIHFTMGGILPVTRRLVLSVLGHILSAVFISIEIMSIIDTLNRPHGTNGHAMKPASNVTGTQYNLKDLQHH